MRSSRTTPARPLITKDQIKDAPEFDEDSYSGDDYRDRIGTYYGPGGTGYANW